MKTEILTEDELVQIEVQKLIRADAISQALSADDWDSRPSPTQEQIILSMNGMAKYLFIFGGNQCLAKGTLVLTPRGPVAIESILPGDTVYDEFGKEIKVLNVFNNGVKPCHSLLCRNKSYGRSTKDHVWLVEDGHGRMHERRLEQFRRDDKIARVRVAAPLGNINVPDAYALGALLGDGCSREHGLAISSADERIPNKVASLLSGITHIRTHPENYTWAFVGANPPAYYADWCKGRYAHDKIVDLEVVKTWDRETCLNFVAGLIDTDGSVYTSPDMINLSYSSQSESIIQALRYLFLALWQVEMSIGIDNRSKYVNGAVFEIYTRNVNEIAHILNELGDYLALDRKRWSELWRGIGGRRSHLNKIGITMSKEVSLEPTYDLEVDSPTHLYLLANGLVTHNSGKTTLILRLLTWAVEESSPYWRRPTDDICNNLQCNTKGIKRHQLGKDYECPKCGNVWTIWPKDQPINVMLIGEQLKNIQENLYEPRIKPLLMNPDEWEEDKLGSTFVQKITNTRTGNSILFFPHGHGAETARKAVQGYSVHYVFTDEQIPKKLIEELQRRVMAKLGIFVCGFTMKKLDAEVVRFVEAQVASGAAKRFYISMLDNPIYAGRKDMIEAQLAGLNEAERNVVLFGEVQFSDEYVFYQVDAEKIAKPIPPTYDAKKWRHVEIIDPAIKSKAGRVIIAQDPDTKIWHVIHVYLLKGMLHDKHLYEAHLALREKEGYDPILSVADDDAGFIGMARHHDTPTKFIFPKSKRAKGRGKLWLIKQTAGTLISGILHIDPKFTLLWDEIRSYQWKENSRTEIVNSHKYHLLDCIMYFIDSLPDEDVLGEIRKTYMQELLEFNHKVGFKSGLDNKKSSQGQRIVAIMKPSQVRIM